MPRSRRKPVPIQQSLHLEDLLRIELRAYVNAHIQVVRIRSNFFLSRRSDTFLWVSFFFFSLSRILLTT